MSVLPALLLTGAVNIDYPLDFNVDPTSPVVGAANKWAATIYVDPQPVGIPLESFTYAYNGTHIQVGHWIASTDNGRALKIVEVTTVSDSLLTVVVEDVDSYNAQCDATLAMDGSIPPGTCLVFGTNEFGFPVLGPLTNGIFLPVAQDNLLARFNQIGDYTFPGDGSGGGSDFLGEPTDTSYDDGAVKGWQVGVTKKDDAIDDLNKILLKALPEQPTRIADHNLWLFEDLSRNAEMVSSLKLAAGAIPNNMPSVTVAPYEEIVAIGGTTASSNVMNVGLGNVGTLTFSVNDTIDGTVNLTEATDIGTFGKITITADDPYPVGTVGVWSALDFNISSTVPDGLNQYKLAHTWTGEKALSFVTELPMTAPVITEETFNVVTPSTVYSSGVPHITTGISFSFTMTGANLVGRTYVSDQLMSFGVEPIAGFITDAQVEPLTISHGPITASGSLTIGSNWIINVPVSGELSFVAYNSRGRTVKPTGTRVNISTVDMRQLWETPPGDWQAGIKRVALGGPEARPAVTVLDWDTNFDSGSAGNVGDLELWDAPIVAGSARVDQTNYSTGYYPAGPDFSGKPTTQYLSFKLKSITNRIRLGVLGTYTGLYIKLPGITNAMPNAVNGWWDATKQADHAPLNWPGHANAGDGCLINADNGEVEITFGNISSADSTENMILVRFELTGDDVISGIRLV